MVFNSFYTLHIDFLVSNFKNFQISTSALPNPSVIMVGNASTNLLVNRIFLFLPILLLCIFEPGISVRSTKMISNILEYYNSASCCIQTLFTLNFTVLEYIVRKLLVLRIMITVEKLVCREYLCLNSWNFSKLSSQF
jgi:hypothetical protein